MKPEALDAFATQTMRPSALEAATSRNSTDSTDQVDGSSSENEPVRTTSTSLTSHTYHPQPRTATPGPPTHPSTPAKPPTPFGQHTDGTQSAAQIVEEIAHGVKVAVDGAIAWAEQKVDDLSREADSTGPYTSPATCVPSDLDCIASGILAGMSPEEKREGHEEREEEVEEGERDER